MTTPAAERPCECARYAALPGARTDDSGALTLEGEPKTTGCVGTPTKKTFAPGHDTKLKSLLIEAGALGAVIRDDTGAITDVASIARRFGFASQVDSGIAKRLAS